MDFKYGLQRKALQEWVLPAEEITRALGERTRLVRSAVDHGGAAGIRIARIRATPLPTDVRA